MSLIPSASTARFPRISASDPETISNQIIDRNGYLRRLMFDARKLKASVGLSGFLVLTAGMTLAVTCTVWGILAGVAQPIAFAAGYCMLVCSACLCAAMALVLNTPERTARTAEGPEPAYAAWKVMKRLRISDASRLWCDIEPGSAASQESLAWAQAMFSAIKNGELAVSESVGTTQEAADRERANPNWATEVDRAALKRWAAAYGHSPRFLQS
jgi:hypothetical protein